jgi:ketosteroid isomerase-like protein
MTNLRISDPTAWLIACEEIRQLASRYAVAMNHRDLDTLVGLFVDDVRVGRDTSGHEALRASFEAQLRPLGRTILQVTNQVIDVDDAEHAHGVVGTRGEIELDGNWIVQVIEYHDEYRRTDDGWRFVRRRHLLWYGAPIGTSPVGLEPAHWPSNAVGEGDLPWSLGTWDRWATGMGI